MSLGTILIIILVIFLLGWLPRSGAAFRRQSDTGRNDRKLFANQPERDTR